MGLFNKLKDEAQNLTKQHPDQASQAADKAEQAADKATGGKYTDQIHSGMQTAQERIGGQPSGQDQDAADDDNQFGDDQNR